MSEQAQEKAEVQGTGPVTIEQLTDDLLTAVHGENKLQGLKDEQVAKAEKLAASLTLENFDALINYLQKPMAAISAASQQIIGDTRLGDVKVIGELFSRFRKAGDSLDVESIHADPGRLERFIVWLGLQRDRLFKFLEQYKRVRAVLQQNRDSVETEMGRRVEAREFLKELKKGVFGAFDELAVAIYAGQLFLQRSQEDYAKRQAELKDSTDIPELAKLKDMYKRIVMVNEEILDLQIARLRSIQDLAVIDVCIENEERLRKKLHTILFTTIPALEKSVAIACAIYGQKGALALGISIEDYTQALDEHNIEALKQVGQAMHQARMDKAQRADKVIENLTALGELIVTETEQLGEFERMAQETRTKMSAAEANFKRILTEDLLKVRDRKVA